MTSASPALPMARALRLAERGRASTHPNPRVGCVILRNGRMVGEGWHQQAGGPHAEVEALREAGKAAQGADVFVTLEPCCHHGRTPPCTDALIAAAVRRVHVAMEDPNPRVAGQGLARLRQAGIEVTTGILQAEALRLNRGFVSRLQRGRPWVTLKFAHSLDGRTAMASGESRWITSEEARADVHRRRAEAGAVLIGANTAIQDDPRLTVREGSFPRQPDRIVLDSRLRVPDSAQVWAEGARRILITTAPRGERSDALRARGVEVVELGADAQERVDLPGALAALGRLEVNEVLVEAGPTLAGALLQSGLVDEVVSYIAPVLLGDRARSLAMLPGLERLEQRLRWRYVDVRQLGPDLRITAVPEAAR